MAVPIEIDFAPREENQLDKLERFINEFPEDKFVVDSTIAAKDSPDYWVRILDVSTSWRSVSYDTLPTPHPNGSIMLNQVCHLERQVQFKEMRPKLLELLKQIREHQMMERAKAAGLVPGGPVSDAALKQMQASLEQLKKGG
jgi:hypothetical protein